MVPCAPARRVAVGGIERMREKNVARGRMLALSWAGLPVSAYLLYQASWYHEHFDAIIRIPFVLSFGVGGVLLGVFCLFHIIRGHFMDM